MNKILIHNCRYLVTRPGSIDGIIEDGAVYIEGSQIVAVGKTQDITGKYSGQPGVDILDAHTKVVLPGLVDAHNHVGEVHTLLVPGWLDTPIRGIFDAMLRMYWPAYNWLSEQSTYDLTLFGLMHLLKHGVTTHTDAMIFPEAIYRASSDAKVRTIIYPQMVSDVQLADAHDELEYLAHTEAAIQDYHDTAGGLIQVGVHPSAMFNCSELLLERSLDLTQKYGVQLVTHLAESPEEMASHAKVFSKVGGVVGYMHRKGLLGPHTVIFHGTMLNQVDIDLLAETGTALVHCPATNAWFGHCAYLPYMLKAGVRVGLGTDCITHNMFSVMNSVLQHHNIMPKELRGVEPARIFELAILGGARVLGMEDSIGSLEPGKKADLITLDLHDNSSLFPLSRQVFYDMLTLNGAGSEACDVLVDGVFLRRDSKFTFLDEEVIIARAREWCDRFDQDYHRMQQTGQLMFHRILNEIQYTFGGMNGTNPD